MDSIILINTQKLTDRYQVLFSNSNVHFFVSDMGEKVSCKGTHIIYATQL